MLISLAFVPNVVVITHTLPPDQPDSVHYFLAQAGMQIRCDLSQMNTRRSFTSSGQCGWLMFDKQQFVSIPERPDLLKVQSDDCLLAWLPFNPPQYDPTVHSQHFRCALHLPGGHTLLGPLVRIQAGKQTFVILFS